MGRIEDKVNCEDEKLNLSLGGLCWDYGKSFLAWLKHFRQRLNSGGWTSGLRLIQGAFSVQKKFWNSFRSFSFEKTSWMSTKTSSSIDRSSVVFESTDWRYDRLDGGDFPPAQAEVPSFPSDLRIAPLPAYLQKLRSVSSREIWLRLLRHLKYPASARPLGINEIHLNSHQGRSCCWFAHLCYFV